MELKIVDLNIWDGGVLLQKVIEFLQSENPSIITLQEVNGGTGNNKQPNLRSIEIIRHELSGYYLRFAPEFKLNRPEGKIDMGNMVLSRFPILGDETTFFGVPYGTFNHPLLSPDGDFSGYSYNLQHVEIDLGITKLDVYNIHGVWGTDAFDNPRRLQMSRTIVRQIKGRDTVILTGDFNVQPKTATIRRIEDHLNNVFGDDLTTTFNTKRKTRPEFSTAVIDMFFVSKNIKVLEKSCPNVDISDHLPLICVLKLDIGGSDLRNDTSC